MNTKVHNKTISTNAINITVHSLDSCPLAPEVVREIENVVDKLAIRYGYLVNYVNA